MLSDKENYYDKNQNDLTTGKERKGQWQEEHIARLGC